MAHRPEARTRPSYGSLVALLSPRGLLGIDVFREMSRVWGDEMKVLRCPKCNAATWDVHCISVNCGWVICAYCESSIYEWESGALITLDRRASH